MTIYAHNGPIIYDVTSVHMIVTDAPRESLDISDDWFEVDAEEAACWEELTGKQYPETQGWSKLYVTHGPNFERIEKWGRM